MRLAAPGHADAGAHGARGLERLLVANIGENGAAASIGQNLASQVRASSEIRGRLSTDHWRTILAARNDFRDAIDQQVQAGTGRGAL